MTTSEDLAKLHCLQSLLGTSANTDLYVAKQIKATIDFAITGSLNRSAPLKSFAQAARDLIESGHPFLASCGLYYIELSVENVDLLWLRESVIQGLREMTGYQTAYILITGTREALCPEGKYWTQRMREKKATLIEYVDKVVANWAGPASRINVLYL